MEATRGRLALLLAGGITGPDWERLGGILRHTDVTPRTDADLAVLGDALGRAVGPVDWNDVDRQLAAMEAARAVLVCAWDDAYPDALRAVACAPPALFVRGRVSALDALAVAIVGTRKPSTAGSAFAHRLAHGVAALDLAVVSGMARGIDTAAHRGALDAGGTTVAVLGTGVDVVYPPENGDLMERIAGCGAVVSEQRCGTQALGYVFPRRNRIISGLSEAVVVVQGGARSGALITAQWALEQGREVGAVPGFPGDFRSEGPNRLLRDGAFLVEDAVDVVAHVPPLVRALGAAARTRARAQASLFPGLDGEAARVYDLVSGGASADDIARSAGIDVADAQRLLAQLEIDGYVERDNLGGFARAARPTRGPGL
jgi:DNA processing protein